MRSLHAFALSVVTLIPTLASAGMQRLALGDDAQPNVVAIMSAAGLNTEPLLLPSTSEPMEKAKATLIAAHALLATHAKGVIVPTLGFTHPHLDLGRPDFRNEIVLWKAQQDGTFRHVGYAVEIRVDGQDGSPWIPVVIGRRGNLKNRLFLGPDSVFALGTKHVSRELLDKVGAADIESPHQLDHVAKMVFHRQKAVLTRAKAAIYGSPKPIAVVASKAVAK